MIDNNIQKMLMATYYLFCYRMSGQQQMRHCVDAFRWLAFYMMSIAPLEKIGAPSMVTYCTVVHPQ